MTLLLRVVSTQVFCVNGFGLKPRYSGIKKIANSIKNKLAVPMELTSESKKNE